jgi:hypothetical protein
MKRLFKNVHDEKHEVFKLAANCIGNPEGIDRLAFFV